MSPRQNAKLAREQRSRRASSAGGGSAEYRMATPRADLAVVRTGGSKRRPTLRENEKSGALIAGIVKFMRKPGISRDVVFIGRKGKPVYAYSVSSEDTTKIIREDVKGNKTVGHLGNGHFKASKSKPVR